MTDRKIYDFQIDKLSNRANSEAIHTVTAAVAFEMQLGRHATCRWSGLLVTRIAKGKHGDFALTIKEGKQRRDAPVFVGPNERLEYTHGVGLDKRRSPRGLTALRRDWIRESAKSDTKLVIFALENTLTAYWSDIWKPDAYLWLTKQSASYQIAIAENYGGIGLNLWQTEHHFGAKWTRPDLPDEAALRRRITRLMTALPQPVRERIKWYGCYAYQSKSGRWSPTPEGKGQNDAWDHNWRKPAPGMVIAAMKKAHVSPAQTVLIGDSADDEAAALAAGVEFLADFKVFDRPPF